MKNTVVLGIETSCDETCAAVVVNGREVLSDVIYSQINIHRKFGGVVPEIASRSHIDKIDIVVEEALERANLKMSEIDAVAVTYGPGLVGALLVGLNYAKGLCYGLNKPLVGVNHIEGHICANYLYCFPSDIDTNAACGKLVSMSDGRVGGAKRSQTAERTLSGFGNVRSETVLADADFAPPHAALIVSGGHTSFVHVLGYTEYNLLGSTKDDAAGEAFDKTARMLGLPYPGGVEIEKLALQGNSAAVKFPRAKTENPLDCSFSGLKSAVSQFIRKNEGFPKADIAASFQEAVADVLVGRAVAACRLCGCENLSVVGGVAANGHIRMKMADACAREGLRLQIPPVSLCTDNAAMIAAAGFFRYKEGERASLDLNAMPGLGLSPPDNNGIFIK